jgi:iron(III) transport system ATP-binding protein
MSDLTLNSIVKEFATGADDVFRAVDNVSAEIQSGEFVTLLGPSGCGKTTILRMIAGFELPSEGDVLIGGQRVNDLPPERRDTAMVFQSYALFPHYRVYDNVAFGLKIRSMPEKTIHEKVMSIIELVGLNGMENRFPNQLSGGQQQRVALARALVMEPKILLFDEPLSNLDAKLRVQMRKEIRKIQRKLGLTSIYVTHDQSEALSLSDKVILMKNGRIEQVGTPRDIYQRPASEFVAEFIGGANFVTAAVETVDQHVVHCSVLGQTLPIPRKTAAKFTAGEEVRIVVRPEGIRLGQTGDYNGEVVLSTFMGAVQEYTINISGQEFFVEEADPAGKQIYSEGEQVKVSFGLESMHIIK